MCGPPSTQGISTEYSNKMKEFNDENFLLQTETAQRLYHEHAARQPITIQNGS